MKADINFGIAKVLSAVARFRASRSGNVAVMFAIAAVPLTIAVGVAVDYSRARLQKTQLQNAVDTAALSGIGNAANLTAAQITANAQSAVNATLASSELTNLNVSASYDAAKLQLTVNAGGSYPLSFMNVGGSSQIPVSQTAVAQLDQIISRQTMVTTKKWPVCLMVTAPTSNHSLFASGSSNSSGSLISINNCMLQVNTANWDAVETDVASASIIGNNSEFCFHGGYIHNVNTHGTVTTTVNGVTPYYVYGAPPPGANGVGTTGVWDPSCPVFNDPLAGISSPLASAACKANALTISTTQTLSPGRYCGNMTISGGTVTFSPGFYHIDGELSVTGGTVNANNVTIYLQGDYAGFDMTGGTVNITPSMDPLVGDLAGVAIYINNTYAIITPTSTKCVMSDGKPTTSTPVAGPGRPGPGGASSSASDQCVNLISGGNLNYSGILYARYMAFWVTNAAVVTATQAGLIADYVGTAKTARLSITGIDNAATASQLKMMQDSQAGYTTTTTTTTTSVSNPRLIR